MNYTIAVFLINRDLRAVMAIYEKEDEGYKNGKRTMFKTLDPTIKKDDYVVVPTATRHGMTVVKVVETDVSVDFDDPTPVAWVVARVDTIPHLERLKMEAGGVPQAASDALHRPRGRQGRRDQGPPALQERRRDHGSA